MFGYQNNRTTFALAVVATLGTACATPAEQPTTVAAAATSDKVLASQVVNASGDATNQNSGIYILDLVSPASAAELRKLAKDKEDPVKCELQTVAGSRIQKVRVCVRDSERDSFRANTRIGLEEALRRSSGDGPVG